MQDRIYQYEPLWGEWKVDELIGEGSFGKVYKVKRTEFGEDYYAAVKIISIPQSETEIKHAYSEGMDEKSVKTYFENFVSGLLKEIRLMSSLKGNSNIVSLEDYKIVEKKDGIGWDILIRMELLKSFMDYMAEKTLSKRDIIKLGIDMCKALELCQKANIIHRDIKPDNIFVSPHGDFKLGDFGIARQIEKTTSGLSKKGTFTYMAPEVYKGEAYNSTVDIYSLGLVLYRLLNNNRTPFLPDYPAQITHTSREESLVRRISGEAFPFPINADGRLAEIVLKACSYKPKDRYENPILMREALESIQYQMDEAPLIYPMGDKVDNKSVDYISTNEPVKPGNDPTESIFGQNISKPFVGVIGNDKTESIFVATKTNTHNISETTASILGFGSHEPMKAGESTESIFEQKTTASANGGVENVKAPSMYSNSTRDVQADRGDSQYGVQKTEADNFSFQSKKLSSDNKGEQSNKNRVKKIALSVVVISIIGILIGKIAFDKNINKSINLNIINLSSIYSEGQANAETSDLLNSNEQSKHLYSTAISTPTIISTTVAPTAKALPTATSTPTSIPTIKIGNYVQMGKYYDEPILWRCVDIDENGPLMLADRILTIKPFDASGQHKYMDGTPQADTSGDRTSWGSNLWETSNMRSWLNSIATAGNVTWPDGCPPTESAVWGGYNDYATEKGFLAEGNFTTSETNAIKSVTQKSILNGIDTDKLKAGGTATHTTSDNISTIVGNFDTAYYHNVTDKMFLLDAKQINKVYLNSSTLGTSYYIGKPTQKAVDNSDYKDPTNLKATSYWDSWLRAPYTGSSYPCGVRLVGSGGGVGGDGAGIYSAGARPAFYINLSSVIFKSGNGTEGNPYIVN